MIGEQPNRVREKILGKASRLFAQRGVESVAMREIAAEAGLSKPGLYYYFEDKETLVLAILVEMLERVSKIVEQAAGGAPDIHSRLKALVNGILSLPMDQRVMIRMGREQFATLSEPARKAFSRGYQQKFIGRIEEILAEGMRSGELRTMDLHRAAWILLGMLFPFLTGDTGDAGDPQEDLVAVFLKGMMRGTSADDH